MINFFSVVFNAVSSFDPDNCFISNVLSRLEAVMGIQIRSVLANIHAQLATTAGVKLKARVNRHGKEIPLPNPDTDPGHYVDEVIFQWSAGNGNHPPTWKYLLEILQDIGLLELSQQINMYMKGIGTQLRNYIYVTRLGQFFPDYCSYIFKGMTTIPSRKSL